MPILILILVFVLVVLGFIFYSYNRLAQLRNVCETNWAQVDVLLRKRADLIPNLVEVVKGYAKHEKDVLTRISKARTEAIATSGRKGDEETRLSSHVRDLIALREAYPDLKASEDFQSLQSELFAIEDDIAERRTNYNDVVKAHNDFVLKFPGNVVAGLTGFSLLELFEFVGSRDAPMLDMKPGEEKVIWNDGQN